MKEKRMERVGLQMDLSWSQKNRPPAVNGNGNANAGKGVHESTVVSHDVTHRNAAQAKESIAKEEFKQQRNLSGEKNVKESSAIEKETMRQDQVRVENRTRSMKEIQALRGILPKGVEKKLVESATNDPLTRSEKDPNNLLKSPKSKEAKQVTSSIAQHVSRLSPSDRKQRVSQILGRRSAYLQSQNKEQVLKLSNEKSKDKNNIDRLRGTGAYGKYRSERKPISNVRVNVRETRDNYSR